MKKLQWFSMAVVLSVLALGVWSGCEQAEGLDGLSVSPSTVTLGGASNNVTTVAFTASISSPLALPMEWRVSNPGLGLIVSHSGTNAIYKANKGAKGDNIVTARDQYGNEGSAVVTQP